MHIQFASKIWIHGNSLYNYHLQHVFPYYSQLGSTLFAHTSCTCLLWSLFRSLPVLAGGPMPRRPSTFCSPSWDPAATTTRKKRKNDVDEQVHSSNLETDEHVVRMLWKKKNDAGRANHIETNPFWSSDSTLEVFCGTWNRILLWCMLGHEQVKRSGNSLTSPSSSSPFSVWKTSCGCWSS